MITKRYYLYILTNKTHTALYVGVTNNLIRRIYEHRNHLVDGFTSRYEITLLVYYEVFADIQEAVSREKQIKGGSRIKKIGLIESLNPHWKDLYETLV